MAALKSVVQDGLDAYLLMIGGDVGDSDPNNRAYARRVRQMIAEYDLAQRIVFTGYVDLAAVSANLLAADMAVMPYRDGVSFRRTTLIAALRHGVPTISTTPAIDLPQVVAGENMALVPAQDVASLAQAIIDLAHDDGLRDQLSQGAKRLGQRFDWDMIATETVKVYENV